MKKIGWYIIATFMTVVFLIGATLAMIGEGLIKLCHEIERWYWNYEADGYTYVGDGIYTKTYKLNSVDDLDSKEHLENVRTALAELHASLEAEPNRLVHPTGICPSCNQERLINGTHKSPLHGGVCAGWGVSKQPAGKAEPEWSTEHLGPGAV